MNAAQLLLAELSQHELSIEVLPNKNLFVKPKDRLNPELRERIVNLKPQLVELLSRPEAETEPLSRPPDASLIPVSYKREPETQAPVLVWRDDPAIPEGVRQEILRWEPQLLVMGWSQERIWRRTFWPHTREHPRGLPALLDVGERIAFADCDYVWVHKHDGNVVRVPRVG